MDCGFIPEDGDLSASVEIVIQLPIAETRLRWQWGGCWNRDWSGRRSRRGSRLWGRRRDGGDWNFAGHLDFSDHLPRYGYLDCFDDLDGDRDFSGYWYLARYFDGFGAHHGYGDFSRDRNFSGDFDLAHFGLRGASGETQ